MLNNNILLPDVEDEVTKTEDENTITKPFNPSDIIVDIATVNLGLILDELENDEIDLSPEFQRTSNVWSDVKKSRLIESILLGLPIPTFFFSEDEKTKKRLVIDGLQRLTTLKEFVLEKENPLRLTGLEILKKFEGATFDDLERAEIRRIKSLKITTNTLLRGTPPDVKFIIFQRVNSGGVPLTWQELRHAMNQGTPARFIKELAESEAFLNATQRRVTTDRMLDRDFANRFVAFYLGLGTYSGEMDYFMSEMMGKLGSYTEQQLSDFKHLFEVTMDTCRELFGEFAFRKVQRTSNGVLKKNPISKSVFDTVSVNVAFLSDAERKKLLERRDDVMEAYIKLCADKTFSAALSAGTGQKRKVETRFSKIKMLFSKILAN